MDARNDSYAQVLAEAGAARQYGNQLVSLGGFGARWAYAQGGLMARVIDLPADLATSRGVTVEGAGPELSAEMDRLKVLQSMSDALRWSLLDGGGALIVMARDGAELSKPLNPAALQLIEEFRVVSLTQIHGDKRALYDDPAQLNYGTPEIYEVDWAGGKKVRVHESRIIEMPGAPIAVSAGLDLRDVPWAGRGISANAVLAIQRYHRGVRWAEKLLERTQQAIHKMKGLAGMLLAGQEPIVRKRIDLVDANRSNLNGVAVDAEDDYSIVSATLTGVQPTLQELQIAVAAETGFPVSVLFGRSPGGLNTTGDSDWDIVFDQVTQLQARRVKPALERAISLIFAQTGADLTDKPETWEIVFNPLKQQTAQQLAEVENKQADTVKKVAEALKIVQETQAVSQDEAHAYLQSQRMFGLEPDAEGGAGAASRYAGQT